MHAELRPSLPRKCLLWYPVHICSYKFQHLFTCIAESVQMDVKMTAYQFKLAAKMMRQNSFAKVSTGDLAFFIDFKTQPWHLFSKTTNGFVKCTKTMSQSAILWPMNASCAIWSHQICVTDDTACNVSHHGAWHTCMTTSSLYKFWGCNCTLATPSLC